MSTQDPIYLENTDYVEVASGVNCTIQVISGSVWFRGGVSKPEINTAPLPDGKRYLGHFAAADGRHNDFNYGVPNPESVYAVAASKHAVIVVTEY